MFSNVLIVDLRNLQNQIKQLAVFKFLGGEKDIKHVFMGEGDIERRHRLTHGGRGRGSEMVEFQHKYMRLPLLN